MKYLHRLLTVASAAFFIASAAFAQSGTVTNHAFAIGKGPGVTGYGSALCTSAQIAVGQTSADPLCKTITGDVTLSAAGAITLATVNANVGSFGSTTQCVAFTVNAKGLITAASAATCAPAIGSITGLGTGVATALGVNIGSAGAFITFNGALGTPSSGTLTNATGLPISTGVSGLGAGCATFLGTPSSANLRGCLTDEVGTGAAYFIGGALGTPASATLTNATGLPLSGLTTQAAWSFVVNNTSGAASPTAVDIASFTLKASPAATDLIVISDQAASGALKRATISSVGSAGSVASINGQTGAVVSYFAPQGRLTLQTGVPVMTTTQSAKTTIFYTPYLGNMVPIYDGTNMVPTATAEISVLTTDTTKNPAAIGASKVNDWFIWNDSGTIRISHGPDWTSDTARSAGTALTLVNGIWLNNASITNGPAASRGTYVGTTRSNGSSQLDFIFGASASGGTAGFFGVWNMYNRVNISTDVVDSGVSYTYSSATTRQARASAGNQVSFVIGQQENAVYASYATRCDTTAVTNARATFGVGLDSTSAFSGQASQVITGAASSAVAANSATKAFFPAIGLHFIAALEASDGTNANGFNSSSVANLSIMLWN